ncbi:MFS transporter [Nakamurella leprariae]|uniref:Putative proline/betaine transporter n=1 Tax=Nakamurella leprariae TaxID=2803911 RepID=A0A939BZJ5_9ACTN|nr:MFS transporter [Nakamurella leprariae]MBM9467771.1 MFS transporter [Nakamurella leprariae]
MTSTAQSTAPSHPTTPRERTRAAVLGTLGNVMEWYDFTVYGFLAAYIAANFFPGDDPLAKLLAAFGIYAVGFVARPLGALVLGPLIDRRGRKSVMLLSMLLMAAGSLLIGIAPTYATSGAFGAVVITVGRLMQGFSAGGEFGSSAVFLVEWANPRRRGLYGSFHQVATYGGLVLGAVLVAALTAAVGTDSMREWVWRVPFLIGAVLAVIVLVLRRRVAEPPAFVAAAADPDPVVEPAAASSQAAAVTAPTARARREVGALAGFMLTLGVVALWGVTSMVTINYMPTYTTNFAGLTPQSALWATVIGGAVAVALIPVAGHLSDRYGRRPFVIGAAVAFLVLPWPLFTMITSVGQFWAVLVAQICFSIPTAAMAGVGSSTISELFPTHRRGTLVSIGSAIAVTLFGGFGAYICTWLIRTTGNVVAPAFYVMAVAVITLVAGSLLPNTADRELRR